MTLENVSSDIWRFVIRGETDTNLICKYISELYEIEEAEISDDISAFIEDLYLSGIIMLDNEYHEAQQMTNDPSPKKDSYETQIISLYEEKDLIYSVTFELTYSCNEKCIHCYATYPQEADQSKKLDIESCKSIIDELLYLKCMHISFTGGDPFMFPDFISLFEYARRKGFSCDIFTNALYLADHPDTMDKIVKLRPQAFYISLYGANSIIHDEITSIPGSFDKTLKSIKKLRASQIPVISNVMILKNNAKELPQIANLAKELDIEYRVGISLIYKNNGSDSPMAYFVNDKEIIKEILTIEKDRFYSIDQPIDAEKGSFFCGAGRTSLSIAPDGTVYPCISLKIALGNAFDNSIGLIWQSPKRKNLLKLLSWDNAHNCQSCEYVDKCPHCVGISQAETGDMFSCNTCDKMIATCLAEINY